MERRGDKDEDNKAERVEVERRLRGCGKPMGPGSRKPGGGAGGGGAGGAGAGKGGGEGASLRGLLSTAGLPTGIAQG